RRVVSYGCFCELGADCAEEVGDVLVAGLRVSKRVEDDESGLIAVFPFGPVDTRGGLVPGGVAVGEGLHLRPFTNAASKIGSRHLSWAGSLRSGRCGTVWNGLFEWYMGGYFRNEGVIVGRLSVTAVLQALCDLQHGSDRSDGNSDRREQIDRGEGVQ